MTKSWRVDGRSPKCKKKSIQLVMTEKNKLGCKESFRRIISTRIVQKNRATSREANRRICETGGERRLIGKEGYSDRKIKMAKRG